MDSFRSLSLFTREDKKEDRMVVIVRRREKRTQSIRASSEETAKPLDRQPKSVDPPRSLSLPSSVDEVLRAGTTEPDTGLDSSESLCSTKEETKEERKGQQVRAN